MQFKSEEHPQITNKLPILPVPSHESLFLTARAARAARCVMLRAAYLFTSKSGHAKGRSEEIPETIDPGVTSGVDPGNCTPSMF